MEQNQKWKIPHSFKEKNFVLQLIHESQIKSKSVMSWSSRKKKEGIYGLRYPKKFLLTFISIYSIVYTFRIYILLHTKKTLLHTLLLLILEFVEPLQCILKPYYKS